MLQQLIDDADRLHLDRLHIDVLPLPTWDRLASIWEDLENRADRPFFLSWSWIGSWLASIGDRPDLLIAKAGDEVVGLALLATRLKTRHRVMPIRTLYLNQTGDDDQDVVTIEYNDILADRRCQTRVRLACLDFLIRHDAVGRRPVGEVVLGGINGALRSDIERLGRPVLERAAAGSAFVDLKAFRSADRSLLDTLKPRTARRIRRSMALYRERGALELTAARSVAEALDFFGECGALHQERWAARGRPGAFAYPFYIAFHRRLIETAFPEGRVELVRVSAGNEPIGYLYNFVDRGRVSYYFSGFRFEKDNRLKPGLVCHSLCIERHLERGMDVYDFMAGDQRYKLELGQPGPRIVTLAVQRPNWILAAERPLRRLKQAIGGLRGGGGRRG
jgi:CelD/BcsL family acetyltransferase involved in cellulose biosynthesis